jgi:hypothetical protein
MAECDTAELRPGGAPELKCRAPPNPIAVLRAPPAFGLRNQECYFLESCRRASRLLGTDSHPPRGLATVCGNSLRRRFRAENSAPPNIRPCPSRNPKGCPEISPSRYNRTKLGSSGLCAAHCDLGDDEMNGIRIEEDLRATPGSTSASTSVARDCSASVDGPRLFPCPMADCTKRALPDGATPLRTS